MQSQNIIVNLNNTENIIKETEIIKSVEDIKSIYVKDKKSPKDIIQCTCGKSISRGSLSYHKRTYEHIKLDKEMTEQKLNKLVKISEQKKDNIIEETSDKIDHKKTKLCSCGQYVSASNYATHLKRPIHINRLAAQATQIKEIDKMEFTAEVKKILIDRILAKFD